LFYLRQKGQSIALYIYLFCQSTNLNARSVILSRSLSYKTKCLPTW